MNSYFEDYEEFEPELPDYFEKINTIISEEIAERCTQIQEENDRLKISKEKYYNEKCEAENKLRLMEKENKSIVDKNMNFLNMLNLVNEDNINLIIDGFNLKTFNYGGVENKNTYYNLVLKHYEDKEKLFTILDAFGVNYPQQLKSFKLPRDYDKKDVLYLIKNIDRKMCATNACYLKDNFRWMVLVDRNFNMLPVEKQTIPLQELLKNKHMLDDDCFDILIEQLSNGYQKQELYSIYKFNKLSENQLKMLANTITTDVISKRIYNDSQVEIFIKNNFNLFLDNKEWLDCAFKKVSDNKYSLFHYGKFPEEYIIKYLSKFELKKLLKMAEYDNISEDIIKKVINNK